MPHDFRPPKGGALARARDLYIGVGNHVVALDYATGTEKWRTKLKTSSVVTVAVIGNRIIAGAGGEVFSLDPSTGKIHWRNRLKGLGVGIVAFSSSDEAAAGAAVAGARAAGGEG
jgi:outer membrane protein assembly factor BamB